jgi:hypothetical protein
MNWRLYFRIGRAVWRLLQQRFPDLAKVPGEDVIAVVEELLTTSASLQDVKVQTELPAAQGLIGRPVDPHYRLVVTRQGH